MPRHTLHNTVPSWSPVLGLGKAPRGVRTWGKTAMWTKVGSKGVGGVKGVEGKAEWVEGDRAGIRRGSRPVSRRPGGGERVV